MRAIEAKTFSGYGGLRQIELPKPQPAKDRVLVRVTAAGVTPLDQTILSGGHPRAKAPLVLGNEGAGVIEDAGDSGLAVGNRVMFTGPYGVGENGAWQEWLLARPEDLALVPEVVEDVVAASLPVAYLTAQITLTLAGFKPGMTVLAPGIGGSVGNATYQLARAQGAGKVISTAGSAAKAARARELGFEDVIDVTGGGLADGVRRITAGSGVDLRSRRYSGPGLRNRDPVYRGTFVPPMAISSRRQIEFQEIPRARYWPSTANERNFAYLSTTFRSARYSELPHQSLICCILSQTITTTRLGGSPSICVTAFAPVAPIPPMATKRPPAALIMA